MIIIDRFENDIAVVEYQGRTYDIPKNWLPVTVKEGDVVTLIAAVDEQETLRRREKIKNKFEDLIK